MFRAIVLRQECGLSAKEAQFCVCVCAHQLTHIHGSKPGRENSPRAEISPAIPE